MDNQQSTTALAVRLATPEDIALIEKLDSFSASPTRDIHRDMEKYFGSVDPSTHEHTFIFIAEIAGVTAGKAELMLPPIEVYASCWLCETCDCASRLSRVVGWQNI